MKKRCLALLLTLAMAFSLLPAAALAAEETVTVKVSAQKDGAFLYPQTELQVKAGTAETYGFKNASTVPEGTVTALDVLVAAHAQKYAAAFTTETAGDYLTMSGSNPQMMFQDSEAVGRYSGFTVNHDYPMDESKTGYMADNAPVSDGDSVDFFYYSADWTDYTAWFTNAAGTKIEVLEAGINVPVTVGLKGYMYMNGYTSPSAEDLYCPDEGLGVYSVDENGTVGDLLGNLTDETGLSLTFDTLGTQKITAMGFESTYEAPIIMPVLTVNVREEAPPEIIPPTGIVVEESQVTLPLNRTHQIKASIEPANAKQDVIYDLLFGEVTVSDTGLVTPKDTATAGSKAIVQVKCAENTSYTANVTITFAEAQGYTLDDAMDSLAAKYADNMLTWWHAAAMRDYADCKPDSAYQMTEAAKQKLVNSLVADLVKNPTSSNSLANAINGLSALGYDPTDITAADGTKYNAVDLLTKIDPEKEKDTWQWFSVPGYVLLACQQGDWATEEIEKIVIQYLLDNREETGGWSTSWGTDSTAMTLQGLAPYYETNEAVKKAVDDAVAVLEAKQGCFGNIASDAVVAMAYAELGKDVNSLAEHIMTHYTADKLFGGEYNDVQGFIAAVSLSEILSGKTSYNPFDFTDVTKVPAVATPDEGGEEKPPVDPQPSEKMKISFTLKTHNATWIPKHSVEVAKDATVGDAFRQVLDGKEDFTYDVDGSYVKSITHNGTTLGEFSMGANSGWKYMVNGVASSVGMDSKELSSGDNLVWYYVTDYTTDTDRDEESFVKPVQPAEPEVETEDGKDVVSLKPTAEAGKTGVAAVTLTDKELTAALKTAGKEKAAALVVAPEVKGKAEKVAVTLPKTGVADVAKAELPVRFQTDAATLTMSPETLADLGGRKGSNVTLSAQTLKNGAVAVEIKVGSSVVEDLKDGVKLTVPAPKAGPATVLVLVDEKGEETILKTSLPGKDVLTVTLPGSATVKVVDNAKTFTDVSDAHWGDDAIAFVTSRDLFNGTGEGAFTPAGNMDRAMVMTVLYRLSGEKAQADGAEWYAEGMAWAKEKGISDGTDPAGSVSREQLAAMLWRYVGAPKTEGGLAAFPDGTAASAWAGEALTWAAEAGILSGDQNGALRPQDGATRAEVAVMLQRFVEHIA